jgi:selenoprotein W-related protein
VGSLKLIPSGGGVFEVTVNGQLLYSKRQTGKFPDPDKIVQAVKAKAQG